MKLLVIYKENAKRVIIEEPSIEHLKEKIKTEFGLEENQHFVIKIFDSEFNDYCDIENDIEIIPFSKIKVETINVDVENVTLTPSQHNSNQNHNESPLRNTAWNPTLIKILPEDFSSQARTQLLEAMRVYNEKGKLFEAPFAVKKECKTVLATILLKCTYYPTTEQYDAVCRALIRDFPCLREPIGSGFSGWKCAVRYKIEDERRKEKSSITEIKNNSGKRSRNNPHKPAPNLNVKKPKKGEVNYAPNLENSKDEALKLKEVMLRNGDIENLESSLDKTFPLRREEINKNPPLASIKTSWPKLFHPDQLILEVKRITNVSIDTALAENLPPIILMLNQIIDKEPKLHAKNSNNNDDVGREDILEEDVSYKVLLQLPKYFKEQWSFYSEEREEGQPGLQGQTKVGIILKNSGIYAIEGESTTLVTDIVTAKEAVQCLIAVYYVCNLDYPKKGKNSLSFLQYICGVKGGKQPQKTMNLITKLERFKSGH
uniref:PB1 domain-containing protein n=1 Tax=Graphocephala atropunctata TaxID=36148 RepID=A0A1B6L1X9_9HEMI